MVKQNRYFPEVSMPVIHYVQSQSATLIRFLCVVHLSLGTSAHEKNPHNI